MNTRHKQSLKVVKIVFFLLATLPMTRSTTNPLEECFMRLGETFKRQQPSTWGSIADEALPVLGGESKKPAVILLVGSPCSVLTYECLSLCVSAAIMKILGTGCDNRMPPHVPGSYFSSWSSGGPFYEKVVEILKKDKVVVVEEIQDLHPNSAIMFLTLADHCVAPVKNGVMILTTVLPEECPESDCQRAVCEYLKKTWGKVLTGDVFREVMDRISNTAIMVCGEDVSSICPNKSCCVKGEAMTAEDIERVLRKTEPKQPDNATCEETEKTTTPAAPTIEESSSEAPCPASTPERQPDVQKPPSKTPSLKDNDRKSYLPGQKARHKEGPCASTGESAGQVKSHLPFSSKAKAMNF